MLGQLVKELTESHVATLGRHDHGDRHRLGRSGRGRVPDQFGLAHEVEQGAGHLEGVGHRAELLGEFELGGAELFDSLVGESLVELSRRGVVEDLRATGHLDDLAHAGVAHFRSP